MPFKTSSTILLSSDYMKENAYLYQIQLPISIDKHSHSILSLGNIKGNP